MALIAAACLAAPAGAQQLAAPTMLAPVATAPSGSTYGVTLYWANNDTRTVSFRIESHSDPSFSTPGTLTDVSLVKSFTLNVPCGPMSFRIYAINKIDPNSAPSNVVSTTCSAPAPTPVPPSPTPTPAQLAPPEMLAPTATAPSGGTFNVNLSWLNQNVVLTGFLVEFSPDATFAQPGTTVNVGMVKSYTVTGLACQTWAFRAYTLNGSAKSAASNVVTAGCVKPTPIAPTATATPSLAQPGAPQMLAPTATAPSGGTYNVTLSWGNTSTTTVTGFRVEYAKDSTFTGSTSVDVGAVKTYTLNGLGCGTWFFRAYALNSTVKSSPSNVVSSTCTGRGRVVGTRPRAGGFAVDAG